MRLSQPFNSLSRDHVPRDAVPLALPDYLPFNSLSRDHGFKELGFKSACELSSFNSLSRDHGLVQLLEMHGMVSQDFQLPLSGSRDHVTYTLVRWGFWRENFQLPLSGSLDNGRLDISAMRHDSAFNSLSRDHSPRRPKGDPANIDLTFNSLSRDHINLYPRPLIPLGGLAFNSLSWDHSARGRWTRPDFRNPLSTPSLGITCEAPRPRD